MTKRLDPDLRAITECVRALDRSTSRRMLQANLGFLMDRYVWHPSPSATRAVGASARPAPEVTVEAKTDQPE